MELLSSLESEPFWAYVILYAGAFGDALAGINIFIHGELFFLSGAYLSGKGHLDLPTVFFVACAGGISGDHLSYLFGRKYGISLFKSDAKLFSHKNYERGKSLFDVYGDRAVFLCRFLGPVSWVTPLLSGVFHVEYKTFSVYNLFGVMLGIAQFVAIGYLGAMGTDMASYFWSCVSWGKP